MSRKFIKAFSLLLILFLIGCGSYYYLKKLWVPKHLTFRSSPSWITSSVPLIAHAGGGIPYTNSEGEEKTATYTNSAEAVALSLKNGYKVIEVDLAYTFDHDLALTHSWPESDTLFMSSEVWRDYKIKGKYTALTFTDLLKMVKNRPDVYIVTDTKSKHTAAETQQEFSLIYDQAMAVGGTELLDRIIPQFYNEEMYDTIKQIYAWPSMIYTLYRQDHISNKDILKFVRGKKDIHAVTMPTRRVDILFCLELHFLRKCTYTHTVDKMSSMRSYMRKFVDGFYTNKITPEDYINTYGK